SDKISDKNSDKNLKTEFGYFLKFFPKIALPFTISDEMQHDFSKENHALPSTVIEQFISRYEATTVDDFTEYIPCFQLPEKEKKSPFVAVVYWKAGLLNYDYVLATYAKNGAMLDKRAIAGMRVVNEKVSKMIATIKDDFTIYAAEGLADDEKNYNANTSKITQLEILDNGHIA
ncbi:MAG: hypothetical protein RL757_1884, partial [Bacteroidota bacterium]